MDFVARFGNKIYYGDASRLDLLRAAEAEKAKAFVLAIDDPEASLRTAEVVRKHFPDLPVFARARNRRHAFGLMDLHVNVLVRETLHSSLYLTEHILRALGFPGDEARSMVTRFRDHDEKTLLAQHAVYTDEKVLIQTTTDAANELRALFEADRKERETQNAGEAVTEREDA